MSDVTHGSALAANLFDIQTTKFFAASADAFVGNFHPRLRHYDLNIPKNQRKPKVQPYAVTDDFCGVAVAFVRNGMVSIHPNTLANGLG